MDKIAATSLGLSQGALRLRHRPTYAARSNAASRKRLRSRFAPRRGFEDAFGQGGLLHRGLQFWR